MEKEKINLIELNGCTHPICDCGANVTIGFEGRKKSKFLRFLFENFKIKSFIQPQFIVGLTQDTDFEIAQCLGCGLLIENNGDCECDECKKVCDCWATESFDSGYCTACAKRLPSKKEYLKQKQKQRNKLNRQIAALKKANLKAR